MDRTATFDIIAEKYDASFSESLTGKEQRNQSRKHLWRFLSGKKNLQVLEINCGTGEDAFWLASLGHTVTATDQSAEMIRMAENKSRDHLQNNFPRFIQCSFEELANTFPEKQYDLIFSNFAGLNCVEPGKLADLKTGIQSLLKENGRLAVVLFGKYTVWETFYYLLKADFRKAFRRWSHKEKSVLLAGDVYQPVYYYSPSRFTKLLRPMKRELKKPVGVAVPPSYLEQAMQKRTGLFRFLTNLDRRLCRFSVMSSIADHTFLLFKNQAS